MAKRADPSHRIVNAALTLAAERSWRDISLEEIAKRARVRPERLRQSFPSKTAILAAFVQQVEASVVSDIDDFEAGDSARDRLFEVLMGCFDVLAKYRDAVSRLAADLPRDPVTAIELVPIFLPSLGWALEAADIPSKGLAGCLRIKGLALVWLATLRVWLDDESPDKARTMSALDRNLRRAERIAQRLWPQRTTGDGFQQPA